MGLESGFFKRLIVGVGFGGVLLWGIIRSLPDGNLHLVACDVGQGDAILITIRSTQILVDGGPDRRVLECLARQLPFWDRTLEAVILTHPQADHLDGLIQVFGRYRIDRFLVNGVANDTAGFRELRRVVLAEDAALHFPQAGDQVRIGSLTLRVLWPERRLGQAAVWESGDEDVLGLAAAEGELNETSVVLALQYGSFDALLAGDIGFSTEEALLARGDLTPVDLIKVGHHGSKYSTSAVFLEVLRPKMAVISVGGRNRYGHPTPETLDRLEQVGARVMRTDLRGDVEIESDGSTFWYSD